MTALSLPNSGHRPELTIVGRSPALREALALGDRAAPTRLHVLIVGETGTGKEMVAQRIHARSRRTGPLVAVNCASLKPELAESLLFGHRRGAFSGAVESTRGHVARASGGTLFLDELTSLHRQSQGSLLRVIETGLVQRVGDEMEVLTDLRLICAVQTDFGEVIAQGEFRRDLYERVAGVTIHLAPLRQRPGDIPVLADHFASEAGACLDPAGIRVLSSYRWPGNVRELKAVISRAALASASGLITVNALESALSQRLEIRQGAAGIAISMDPEAQETLRACEAAGWKIKLAARLLGIGKSTLYRRLVKHDIRPPSRSSTRRWHWDSPGNSRDCPGGAVAAEM
jgi:DNA-binding NtrC family response regulator